VNEIEERFFVSLSDPTGGAALGSPSVAQVNVSSRCLPVLTVTPAGNFAATGNRGGPFSPPSATYRIANNDICAANWTAATAGASPNWLTLNRTSGALAPGSSVLVAANINTNANGLIPGVYASTVSFRNATTNTLAASRSAQLTVNGNLSLVEHKGIMCVQLASPGCVTHGVMRVGECRDATFIAQGLGENPPGHTLRLDEAFVAENYSASQSLLGNVLKPITMTRIGGDGMRKVAKMRIFSTVPANMNTSNYVRMQGDIVGLSGRDCNIRFMYSGVKRPKAAGSQTGQDDEFRLDRSVSDDRRKVAGPDLGRKP
jgi:hypothetical protein